MTFIRKKKVGDKVYLVEVKNVRENGKIKQKFVKYIGREVNGKAVKKVAREAEKKIDAMLKKLLK